MDKSLRTWRLTPNKDSDLWNQSSYRGEVWVRAYDAIEARKLTAQRFRVRPRSSDRRRARMESPWYVRELTHCEVDQNPRFDSVEMPCVVCPVPDANMVSDVASNVRAERAVIAQEPATDTAHPNTAAQLQRASHDVVASDVRQTMVALLVAKEIGVPGRWLDVYAARKADNEPV